MVDSVIAMNSVEGLAVGSLVGPVFCSEFSAVVGSDNASMVNRVLDSVVDSKGLFRY